MKTAEREAQLLVKLARVRAKAEDVREELAEAGFERTAEHVRTALSVLDSARRTLMAAVREAGKR